MTDEKRPANKRLHRWIMLFCGSFMFASGLAAAYLAFSADGGIPGVFFGLHSFDFLRGNAFHLPSSAPVGSKDAVSWNEWGPRAFSLATSRNQLVLLNWTSRWSHECRLMDVLNYSDPGVAAWIREHVVPVRVDSDDRPDLAVYVSAGWPTTALLLPTGEILAEGTFMPPDRFLKWAKQTESAWRSHPQDIAAARDAEKRRADEQGDRLLRRTPQPWAPEQARQAVQNELVRLRAQFDPVNGGFGKGWKFPSPQIDRFLLEMASGERTPTAGAGSLDRMVQTLRGELRLADPVWGGFYRYSDSPDWRSPHFEKLLGLQADAVETFAAAFRRIRDPQFEQATERTIGYVRRFLAEPDGFFSLGQAADLRRPDGSWVEGARYYRMTEARRSQVGTIAADPARYSAPNAEWATALLMAAGDLGKPEWRREGLALADRLWKIGAGKSGRVRHRLDQPGPSGLLADELAMARMQNAALSASHDRRYAERFLAVFHFIRQELPDAASGGYRASPAEVRTGPEAGWPALDPDLTASAALLFLDASARIPDPEFQGEARRLAGWTAAHAEIVDPALYARVALRAAGDLRAILP